MPIKIKEIRFPQHSGHGLPAISFVVALVLLRLLYVRARNVNSDEPQYLHVVWGWANHLLAYRDFFDNHAPLFFILFSPLVTMLGERPDILLWMRLFMLLFYGLALWGIYAMARQISSRRVSWWTVGITAVYPTFFLTSAEFRPDNLWMVCWFFSMTMVLQQRFSLPRVFLLGLLAGAAFSTLMKSVLLFPALILAYGVVNRLRGRPFFVLDKAWVARAGAALAGFLIIPLGIIFYFFARHALGDLYYGVIQHNIVPGLGSWSQGGLGIFCFAQRLLLTGLGVWWIGLYAPETPLKEKRLLVFLTLMIISLLLCWWPIVSKETLLAIIPLVIVLLTPLVLTYAERQRLIWIPILIVTVELGALFLMDKPVNKVSYGISFVKDVLTLTDRDDVIMDTKGEMIFRQRAFYYCLETITKKRMENGSIKDTEIEDMIRHRVGVVVDYNNEYTPRTDDFIHENYVPLGKFYVAGKVLPAKSGEDIPVDIKIPQRYTVVSRKGSVPVLLDGRPYQGAFFLEAGVHNFRLGSSDPGPVILVWARAVERGFSPFGPKEDKR